MIFLSFNINYQNKTRPSPRYIYRGEGRAFKIAAFINVDPLIRLRGWSFPRMAG
jgi:hypothetical protein